MLRHLQTLTARATLLFALLVTVTTAVVLAGGAWLLDRQMRRGLELLHEGEGRELLGFLAGAERTPEAVRTRVLRDSEGDAEWFYIQIHDGAGTILFRSANLGSVVLPDLGDVAGRGTFTLPQVGEVLMSEIREDGWHIQVGSPLNLERLLLSDYLKVSLTLLAAAAVAGLVMGYGFSRATLRPVRAIALAAARINAENLQERIPATSSGDELAELTRVLNRAFDRLEVAMEQTRRFAADASHELKTPLSLMRLNAERMLQRGRVDGGEVEDLLEAMARLQTVIDRLLFLARADGGGLELERQRVASQDLAREMEADAMVLLEEVGGRFEVTQTDAGQLEIDFGLIRQLLLNLLTNAARVTPTGGKVTLAIIRTESGWSLTVADEGPGLPEAQLESIFERFVQLPRVPSHDGQGVPGHGLGLAICRSIAHLHGGTIRAENRPDNRPGLCVVVTLPMAG